MVEMDDGVECNCYAIYMKGVLQSWNREGVCSAPSFLAMHPLGAGAMQREMNLQINWCIADAEDARRIAKRAETELASVLLIWVREQLFCEMQQ